MTDEIVKKKRRRRRKRPAGAVSVVHSEAAGLDLQTILAALQAQGLSVVVPPEQVKSAAADAAEARQAEYAKQAEEAGRVEQQRIASLRRTLDQLAEEILALALTPRHMEAFNWQVQASGLTLGHLLQQVLRTAAASWRQDMLEARGQGGGTTRKEQPTG